MLLENTSLENRQGAGRILSWWITGKYSVRMEQNGSDPLEGTRMGCVEPSHFANAGLVFCHYRRCSWRSYCRQQASVENQRQNRSISTSYEWERDSAKYGLQGDSVQAATARNWSATKFFGGLSTTPAAPQLGRATANRHLCHGCPVEPLRRTVLCWSYWRCLFLPNEP